MIRTAIAHTHTHSRITIPALSAAALSVSLSALVLLTSCQPKANNPNAAPLSETGQISDSVNSSSGKPSKNETAKPSHSVANAQKITFRHPDGTPEFSLQFKSTGGKLLDSSGKVITNLILQSDGAIRLTDENSNIVGYVSRVDNSLQIEGPKRTKTLFSFSTETDGSALLTRSNGSTVYQLDTTETGYIVASDKAALYAVQTQKGAGQMQTTDGQVVIGTDSAIAPSALAIFGFEKLTKAQQAGLAYAISTQET